ncbi:hypothetical protein AVEN_149464-1 [Araneus ventricosus]|uniref:Uncharacterized protein n=1 Tax=Araneus ventricosus TaxID=182803 RepID=A0A4Y2JKF7_ARAVE|nr:hypothetical protein AVEN_149464-1 [Araneus ventricosus]
MWDSLFLLPPLRRRQERFSGSESGISLPEGTVASKQNGRGCCPSLKGVEEAPSGSGSIPSGGRTLSRSKVEDWKLGFWVFSFDFGDCSRSVKRTG